MPNVNGSNNLPPALRFALVSVGILSLAGAAISSIWIGYADYWARQSTLEGTEKAIALAPGNAAYHFQLAALISDADPQKAAQALLRSVALNPVNARSLIELGLRAETEGRLTVAEQYFLRAAEIDKEYLPKWTLVNHYFRRGDTARFWLWARSAAAMLYGDPSPMFRLCGVIAEDGALLDRLEIRDPDIQAAYLSYLLTRNRVDLVGPSSIRLLHQAREKDIPLLLSTCDRLIDADRAEGAVAIWNGLAKARRIPFKALDPDAEIVDDGAFAAAPTSQGFDWRLPAPEGVSASLEDSPPGLRIDFSGKQPELCPVVYRVVPVRPATAYVFTVRSAADGFRPDDGLAWRVTDSKGTLILAGPQVPPAKDGYPAEIRFATPSGCRMVRLVLAYERARGTTRIEGSIVLREASLKRPRG